MIYRITFYGNQGTIYSYLDKYYEAEEIEVGEWKEPFPNEENNSTAFGLIEALTQSESCPVEFYEGEEVIKVKVEECKEEK